MLPRDYVLEATLGRPSSKVLVLLTHRYHKSKYEQTVESRECTSHLRAQKLTKWITTIEQRRATELYIYTSLTDHQIQAQGYRRSIAKIRASSGNIFRITYGIAHVLRCSLSRDDPNEDLPGFPFDDLQSTYSMQVMPIS